MWGSLLIKHGGVRIMGTLADKTVIVVYDYGYINGGAAKIAIKTAIDLAKNHYSVIYFCACGPIDEDLSANVKNIICLDQYDILHDPNRVNAAIHGVWNHKAYEKMNNVLDGYNSENVIVHIHGFSHALSSSIIKSCNKHNIVPFITLHDYFAVCPNGGFYNFKLNRICTINPMSWKCIACNCDSRSYAHKMYRCIRQKAQDKYIKNNTNIKYIYISRFSWDLMNNLLKSRRSYYIHNPIDDLNSYSGKEANRDSYLFIGRISPEKGTDLFCEALSSLKLKGVLVGSGDNLNSMKEQYPDIHFTGWQNKDGIKHYLRNAKCLVFPSKWYEVSPLTTEEALRCGVPCIVPDDCAASEQIVDGVNGLIFKSGDLQDLENKIEEFEIKQNIFIKNALDNKNKYKFDESDYLKNLLKIYNQ